MARTLFIVSRRHIELYDYLKDRFAVDDQVEVILDRRGAEEGTRLRSQATPDRRTRPEVDAELETRSHAVITVA